MVRAGFGNHLLVAEGRLSTYSQKVYQQLSSEHLLHDRLPIKEARYSQFLSSIQKKNTFMLKSS
jgi:hypothetical protein